MTGVPVAYSDEVILTGWSDSGGQGRRVQFLLPEGPDSPAEHPFKRYTRRIGKKGGTRFQMVLVEIGDDEHPVDRDLVGGPIAKHAGRLCKDIAFQQYLVSKRDSYVPETFESSGVCSEDMAAEYVRRVCGVERRRLLDHSHEAAETYQREIVGKFTRWHEE